MRLPTQIQITPDVLAERLAKASAAIEAAKSLAGVNSTHHTLFAALIQHVEPSRLAEGKESIVAYTKGILSHALPIQRRQYLDFVTLVSLQRRWQWIFTDIGDVPVLQCLIIQALTRLQYSDSTLLYLISNVISQHNKQIVNLRYDTRIQQACTAFFGLPWWELACDLFDDPEKIDGQLYALIVEQSGTKGLDMDGFTLPTTLV